MTTTTEPLLTVEVGSIIALRAHEAQTRLELHTLGFLALSPQEEQKARTLASQIGSTVL